MVTKLYSRITFLLFFLLAPCCYTENLMKDLNLNIVEAYEKYKENNLLIVDVRTNKEWNETGVIPNSILVNMHDDNYQENSDFIEKVIQVLKSNAEKNITFICASGARSEIVASFFLDKGYKNISHIPEGIIGKNNDGWLYLGYPLKSLEIN